MFYRQLGQLAMKVCQTHIEDDWLSIHAYIPLGKLSQSAPNKIRFRHPIIKRLTIIVCVRGVFSFFFLQSVKNCICEVN